MRKLIVFTLVLFSLISVSVAQATLTIDSIVELTDSNDVYLSYQSADASFQAQILHGSDSMAWSSSTPLQLIGVDTGQVIIRVENPSTCTQNFYRPRGFGFVVGFVFGNIDSALVQGSPNITTQPDGQTVATVGDNITLSVSALCDSTYQWQKDGVDLVGEVFPVLILNNIQLSDSGAYTLNVMNSVDTTVSDTAYVVVQAPPVITLNPTDTTLISGDTAIFIVAASGTDSLSYQWYLNGVAIPGATNDTLIINGVDTSDAGLYTCSVTNMAGSDTSTAATLVVNVPAQITVNPVSLTVNQGDTTIFYVVAIGTQPIAYQWQKDSVDIPGETNDSLVIVNTQPSDTGEYRCYVVNIAGSDTSSNALLSVNEPPVITLNPTDTTLVENDTLVLVCQATGTPMLNYQWHFDSTAILGATNATLNIFNVDSSDAGDYYCTCSNMAGSDTSLSATVTVTPGPDVIPPIISSVWFSSVDYSSFIVNSTTDEVTTSQVYYSEDQSYTNLAPFDSLLALTHSVSITGVKSSTMYYVLIMRTDAAGNLEVWKDSVMTPIAPPQPSGIPVSCTYDDNKFEISSLYSSTTPAQIWGVVDTGLTIDSITAKSTPQESGGTGVSLFKTLYLDRGVLPLVNDYTAKIVMQNSTLVKISTVTMKCSFITSVAENDLSQINVELFPNPASERITVRVDGLNSGSVYEIRIYDLGGRLVLQRSLNTEETVISRGDVSPGEYIYRVNMNTKVIHTGKILFK
ncbi:hypothetical protein COB64_04620 [Candidatus Wolfebacteria bacterium]|nr:MAG: hypothetical protein COB64_04620 [Candidatus Wolfebacteria bacterium]